MIRPRFSAFLLAALAAMTPYQGAEAQLGGLTKKLKEKVKGPEQQQAKQASGPNFGGDLLEITEPVLDGFIRGLRVEIALQKEFRDQLAKHPTRDQYDACVGQVPRSEEGQKVAELMVVPDDATDQQRMKAMEKFRAELAALVKRKCPLEPFDSQKMTARFQEILLKAAEAAGTPPGEEELEERPLGGPFSTAMPLARGPLTVAAYQLLKERAMAFCMAKFAPNMDFSVSPVPVPGQGNNIYYVYTAAEAKALQAKCSVLTGLLSQLAPV